MKTYLIILLLFCSSLLYAQYRDYENVFYMENSMQRDNTFRQKEIEEEVSERENSDPKVSNKGPGAPGEPVPIDNYIIYLFIAGLGSIVYFKRSISSVK